MMATTSASPSLLTSQSSAPPPFLPSPAFLACPAGALARLSGRRPPWRDLSVGGRMERFLCRREQWRVSSTGGSHLFRQAPSQSLVLAPSAAGEVLPHGQTSMGVEEMSQGPDCVLPIRFNGFDVIKLDLSAISHYTNRHNLPNRIFFQHVLTPTVYQTYNKIWAQLV
jgi:hypothetical protein